MDRTDPDLAGAIRALRHAAGQSDGIGDRPGKTQNVSNNNTLPGEAYGTSGNG